MKEAFVIANWGWQQWLCIILGAIELGMSLANDGKRIEKSSVGATAISLFVWAFILASGGFFDVMHWPQVVYIILFFIGLAVRLSDERDYTTESFLATLIADAIVLFLFAKGGFFR